MTLPTLLVRAPSHTATRALALPGAILVALNVAGCATPTPPVPVSAPRPLESIEQRTRLDGATYYASCTDCAKPTPKLRPNLAVVVPRPAPLAMPATSEVPPVPERAVQAAAAASAPEVVSTRTVRATLYFGSGQATPEADSASRLQQLKPVLERASHVVVTGYTDNRGSARRNRRLAGDRASTVAQQLVPLLPTDVADRLVLSADPRCCYAAPNRSAAQRRVNRRVEVVLTVPDTPDITQLLQTLGQPESPRVVRAHTARAAHQGQPR